MTPVETDDALTIMPMSGCPGARIIGEVDLATVPVLQAALDGLVGTGGDVHLELAGLGFVDLSGAAALVAAAARLPAGHVLVLHDPPPALTRILGRFWGEVARIRVDTS